MGTWGAVIEAQHGDAAYIELQASTSAGAAARYVALATDSALLAAGHRVPELATAVEDLNAIFDEVG